MKKVWCLFEQSGTFKNEFIKLGFDAVDVDIDNMFGETDIQIDLFAEIEKAYNNEPSLFDEITQDDLIFAFFPCTSFSTKMFINAQGKNAGMKNWSIEKKLEYSRNIISEMSRNYNLLCKLFIIALRNNLKMIVENPATRPNVLHTFFPVEPALIDKDRSKRGDYYKKPTKYFFVNCEPKYNFIFENIEVEQSLIIKKERGINRSLISPTYANRFIREFIIDETEEN